MDTVSFKLKINTDFIEIEPGSSKPLQIYLSNESNVKDEFEIQIEGLDYEWFNISSSHITLDPGQVIKEKILIAPVRTSESLAGIYPFTVKVRCLRTGEIDSVHGNLQIIAFNHISIDITPKKGIITPFKHTCDYQLQVMNLGNKEQTLKLYANDVDDACVFEFESETLVLGAGQQKSVALQATGTRRMFLGNSNLYGISVFARSIDSKTVVATTQMQLEQRTLASPAAFIVSLIFLAIMAGWLALIPKPPTISKFVLSQDEVEIGKPIRIIWHALDAESVQIFKDDLILSDHLEPVGEKEFIFTNSGQVQLTAIAIKGEKKSAPKSAYLVIKEPAQIPLPEILSFEINPKKLNVGQTLSIKYNFNEFVTRAWLSPPGISLDTKIREIEIATTRPGEITYNLVAENASGITTERKIKINVTEASAASIIVFKALPSVTDPIHNQVQLVWQLANAVRAEIRTGEHTVQVDEKAGSRTLLITKPEILTLIGYDQNGRTVERQIQIDYKESSETNVHM